jgi:hypothetical protein
MVCVCRPLRWGLATGGCADHGLGYEPSERTKPDLYRELLPGVNVGGVELLDLSGGRHDLADAAAGGVVAAVEGPASQLREPEDDDSLNCWEPEFLEHEDREVCRSKHRPRRGWSVAALW